MTPITEIRTSPMALLLGLEGAGRQLARGRVAAVEPDGALLVHPDADGAGAPVRCDLLATSDAAPLTLAEGDVVLLWAPGDGAGRGVVLGRIGGGARPAAPAPAGDAADVPDELVIEARESLTLKVGDGSITLRGDGRILIKGKDLVSHAQRTNRIRGGAVAIN